MKKKNYDVVVIGAGSGGLTTAISLSGAGKSVALIEREKPGGECTHSGCVPSKALLHQAKQMKLSGNINGAQALENTRERIEHIYKEETPEKLSEYGIDVIKGEAEFVSKCSVRVGEIEYGYKKAVISTGSSPRMIEIDGLSSDDVLTNQNIFEQTDIPENLLVIGSGPIGMEMSQACSMLGSQVTLASIDNRFARLEDPAVAPVIKEKFKSLGITTHLNAYIKRVENKTAFFDIKDEDKTIDTIEIPFDKVLIAIGRVPNIPQGLEIAGIESTKYGITIDKHMRTTNRHVFAIGDVSQRLKFTHTANDSGRAVVQNILTRGWWKASTSKAVPKVTYTTPEIAQVGISYEQAVHKYGELDVIRIEVPYSTNDRAKTDFVENGLVIVVAKRLSGRVLGANIVGHNAGDVLTSYTLAIDHRISLWKLSKTIYPYPTISQVVKKSADEFAVQSLKNLKGDVTHWITKHATKAFALLFWGALLYWFYHFKMVNDYSFKDMLSLMVGFLTNNVWGPVIYMTVYILRPLIFFPATILTALSGALFGLPLGILFTVIGENGSANLAYWIGRFFGKDAHLEDNALLGSYVEKARDNPFLAVLLMRFLYVPFDLTNYGSGILKIKWSSYFWATLFGIMPGLVTFVALGASIDLETLLAAESLKDLAGGFNIWSLLFAIVLFVGSIFFGKYFKKHHG